MSFRPPKRRKQSRSADNGREWPTHRAFVRKHECIVPGCRADTIRACHARDDLPGEDSGGMAIKPFDWWTWPGCDAHHTEQHQIGERAFDAKYGVDMRAAAKWLADHTPDKRMREFIIDRLSQRTGRTK